MKKVMALNSLRNLFDRKLDRKKLVAFNNIQNNQINVRLKKPAQISLDTIQTDHSVETSRLKHSAEIPGMTAAQSIFKSPTNGTNQVKILDGLRKHMRPSHEIVSGLRTLSHCLSRHIQSEKRFFFDKLLSFYDSPSKEYDPYDDNHEDIEDYFITRLEKMRDQGRSEDDYQLEKRIQDELSNFEERIQKQDTIDEYCRQLEKENPNISVDPGQTSLIFDEDEEVKMPEFNQDSSVFRNSQLDESDRQFFGSMGHAESEVQEKRERAQSAAGSYFRKTVQKNQGREESVMDSEVYIPKSGGLDSITNAMRLKSSLGMRPVTQQSKISLDLNSLLDDESSLFGGLPQFNDLSIDTNSRIQTPDNNQRFCSQASNSEVDQDHKQNLRYVKEDIEDMTKELERIRDFVFQHNQESMLVEEQEQPLDAPPR